LVPPTATTVPTSTATASPTATVTDTPEPTATPSPSIADELAALGLGRYLGVQPDGMQANGDWDAYLYEPREDGPICLRGDPYQVEVHRGTNNKVLLYLEGGGACWNYDTCWKAPLAKLTANPAFGDGILALDREDNPFHDWNIVYAPYCDGSVFSGDNIADYQGNKTYHHGLANLSAAVTVLQNEFPDPDQIVVSGSSAGGYGTYSGYGVTRVAFPDKPILVLDDSGPGLQNNDDTEAVMERNENWNYRQFIPPSCTNCDQQITYLTEWSFERDPDLRFALFSYLQDGVIRAFNALSADAFESLLRTVTDDIHSRYPQRFKRFFPQGTSHTVLETPAFYTLDIAGLKVRDWTADFLADGPNWQDVIEGFNPYVGFNSARYADPSMWLCRPDLATDECRSHDLDATAIEPDLSLQVEPHTAAADPPFDCFYIYPTVDLSATPGNHTDFSDISPMLDPLLNQAARFNGTCRVFAPLYRQVTLGTYSADPSVQQPLVDLAYSDVEEAFRQYMGQYNHGRNFVIMGHSQGTFMATRLVQNEIDGVPGLRARLITALLIGGSVVVPDGQTVGGSFQNVPLCSDAEQTGCAIAYRSYADGYPPANGSNVQGPEGMDTACTNPAALGGGKAFFATTYLPLFAYQPIFSVGMEPPPGVETPFLAYHDFYTGECVRDDHNRSYLRIAWEAGDNDQRSNEIPFGNPLFSPAFLGTHVLDYNFALDDLIDLVRTKAQQMQ
jgi:Protein of unknown function (DUF3089)/Pectinacetylesterase